MAQWKLVVATAGNPHVAGTGTGTGVALGGGGAGIPTVFVTLDPGTIHSSICCPITVLPMTTVPSTCVPFPPFTWIPTVWPCDSSAGPLFMTVLPKTTLLLSVPDTASMLMPSKMLFSTSLFAMTFRSLCGMWSANGVFGRPKGGRTETMMPAGLFVDVLASTTLSLESVESTMPHAPALLSTLLPMMRL